MCPVSNTYLHWRIGQNPVLEKHIRTKKETKRGLLLTDEPSAWRVVSRLIVTTKNFVINKSTYKKK